MKRTIRDITTITLVTLYLISMGTAAAAQDKKPAPVFYKLEFSIFELQDGKRVNPHTFVMSLQDDDRNGSIRIGNRVPIAITTKEGATSYQYIDVGVSIGAQLRQTETGLLLRSNVDVSSFATPEQDIHSSNPILRNFRADAVTVVEMGKPTLLNSIDDVSSNKRMQIEVTVTKIK